MDNRKKILATGLLSAAFLVGMGSVALAESGSIYLNNNAGAEFDHGSYYFNPPGTGRGGFVVNGYIWDTARDGNGVYGQGRVEGYEWSDRRGDPDGSGPAHGTEDREFVSWADTQVNRGQYQVCTDDWGSDTCATSRWYYR